MEQVLNYIKIDEKISTSGQPTQEEFERIASNGFAVVINLALSSAANAVENEDVIVKNLGMNYIHIPVDFENPTLSDLKIFMDIMVALNEKKVWVHCAKNYRVSAFMYVYHKYILRTPFEEINLSLFEEWSPNAKWQELMKAELQNLD
ncbi:MAG: protein tyrosine phosphatase family protein [Candidatus Marinarcus sp.]|uniref:protein tyrosine phosphatase family protein n=1 Tax=Candidatus Marinarcus sp. TaxID=3100987 RepID=UPI003B004FA2